METQEHAQEKHLAPRTRSLTPPIRTRSLNTAARAIAWCFPWTSWEYPGIERGTLSLLPRPYNKSVLRDWRLHRAMPTDVALAFADYIESRCRAGMALVKELRHYAEALEKKPKHNQGFMQIRERNGITSDARGKGARKK